MKTCITYLQTTVTKNLLFPNYFYGPNHLIRGQPCTSEQSMTCVHGITSKRNLRESFSLTNFILRPGYFFCNTTILYLLKGTNINITSTADSELEDSVVVAEDGSSSGHSSLAERANKSHLVVWQVATA